MIQGGRFRNLSDKERSQMKYIYHKTQKIRQFMKSVQTSMHHQFDQMLQTAVYKCVNCKYEGQAKHIAAHYRNKKQCKYMKDRPWLEQLPTDWQIDLMLFQKQVQQDSEYSGRS